MTSSLLPQSFYAREALEVALHLLGKHLRHGPVTLRITEVEAYRHPDDTANHCRAGKTIRNAAMWGPPGHAYVYLCYGLHQMLNLVTDADGKGAAVLIRACEIVSGEEHVRARRGGKAGPVLLTGPGKVASALAVDRKFTGQPLYEPGALEVHDAEPVTRFVAGPRVGIDFATPEHRAAPWRLAVADSLWVTQRATLSAVDASARAFLKRNAMPTVATPKSATPTVATPKSRRL
jgi:DNA-3-methyladenine glycosylase